MTIGLGQVWTIRAHNNGLSTVIDSLEMKNAMVDTTDVTGVNGGTNAQKDYEVQEIVSTSVNLDQAAMTNVPITALVPGLTYKIKSAGNSNFTSTAGAADSVPGTLFVALAVGTGTGTADIVLATHHSWVLKFVYANTFVPATSTTIANLATWVETAITAFKGAGELTT